MNRVFKCLMYLILLASTQALAVPAHMQTLTTRCTQSATLLACSDALGNRYSLATAGSTSYVRGFEVGGNRLWAQTNSRYGLLTFFTGLASNGETWVGYSQRVGWTTITRVSSSDGNRSKFTCNRMGGCH